MSKSQFFESVKVISLKKDVDRRLAFFSGLDEFPFTKPVVFDAIDGHIQDDAIPDWWGTKSAGGWGAYLTHLSVYDYAMNEGVENVLIMEDDCVLCDNFRERVCEFIDAVPDDWDMLYLGGEHLNQHKRLPKVIGADEKVCIPFNVNRLHCYAVRKRFLPVLMKYLRTTEGWHSKWHIDHKIGNFIEKCYLCKLENEYTEYGIYNIYCPKKWLCYQRGGISNITNKVEVLRKWDIHNPYFMYKGDK